MSDRERKYQPDGKLLIATTLSWIVFYNHGVATQRRTPEIARAVNTPLGIWSV